VCHLGVVVAMALQREADVRDHDRARIRCRADRFGQLMIGVVAGRLERAGWGLTLGEVPRPVSMPRGSRS
jgi:hypothetical protein